MIKEEWIEDIFNVVFPLTGIRQDAKRQTKSPEAELHCCRAGPRGRNPYDARRTARPKRPNGPTILFPGIHPPVLIFYVCFSLIAALAEFLLLTIIDR